MGVRRCRAGPIDRAGVIRAGGRGGDFTLATGRRLRSDLKAALYDGRLETHECAPAMDGLLALERNKQDGKVDYP